MLFTLLFGPSLESQGFMPFHFIALSLMATIVMDFISLSLIESRVTLLHFSFSDEARVMLFHFSFSLSGGDKCYAISFLFP